MSKFNVNDEVIVIATGEQGVVKAKEVTTATDGNKKHITIQYIVKVGEGFANWKVFYRRELKKVTKEKLPYDWGYTTKTYENEEGYKITMVAKTDSEKISEWNEESEWNEDAPYLFTTKIKSLNIGYAICNPVDEYNRKIGFNIAKKRLHSRPFAHMSSTFSGEFNKETVEAIMDVKAKYLFNNLDKFINK